MNVLEVKGQTYLASQGYQTDASLHMVQDQMVSRYGFKAMEQLISITVCKVIQKTITKMNFRYQTDVNKRAKNVCLVPKNYFSY